MPTDKLSLPEQDEVTVDWLAEALGQPGELEAFDAVEIGTGQVGSNVRYTLRWRNGSGPASVVGKFPAADELSRRTGGETESYIREVGFYRDLQVITPLRTPEVFHVDENVERNQFVLIMEDLANSVQGDQLAGCSAEAAHQVVDAAADLHGPHWGNESLTDLSWVHKRDADRAQRHVELYALVVPGFLDRYRDRLDDKILALGPWLGDNLATIFDAFRLPPTLVHGDYRLDNMMFGNAPDGPPLVVVDWQTCALGYGANDLAYFIGAGLLPDDRRLHEADLVSTYASALSRRGVDVDRSDLDHDYRLGTCAGFLMAVIASQIVAQTERGDEMFCVMAERHGAQMMDLDVAGLIS